MKSPNASDAVQRLEKLIKAGRVIPYMVDNADREFSGVRWGVYGAPDTGELFVSATNGTVTFVRTVVSDLVFPPMADRVFGIDARDLRLAEFLSAAMWRDHRDALLSCG